MLFQVFEHGFYFTNPQGLHDVIRLNVAVRNEHFVYALADVSVVRNDVQFCEPTPFLHKTDPSEKNSVLWADL